MCHINSEKQLVIILKAIHEAIVHPTKVVVIVGSNHEDVVVLNKLYVHITSDVFRSECGIIFRTPKHRLTASFYSFIGYDDV